MTSESDVSVCVHTRIHAEIHRAVEQPVRIVSQHATSLRAAVYYPLLDIIRSQLEDSTDDR